MAATESFSATHPGNPQPGDLIEIFRPAYQHWALYLGDGYIINVTPVDEGPAASFASAKSVFSRKARVRMQLLKDVVGNDTYQINNKYDDTYPPLPVEEIIRRAEYLIDQEVSYDLLGNNCEHFVTLLRYGEGVSEQGNPAHAKFRTKHSASTDISAASARLRLLYVAAPRKERGSLDACTEGRTLAGAGWLKPTDCSAHHLPGRWCYMVQLLPLCFLCWERGESLGRGWGWADPSEAGPN